MFLLPCCLSPLTYPRNVSVKVRECVCKRKLSQACASPSTKHTHTHAHSVLKNTFAYPQKHTHLTCDTRAAERAHHSRGVLIACNLCSACVYVCVSGCQPLRWCCVTAAVQPPERAAHNDTLDILMMPPRVHYWCYLAPLHHPGLHTHTHMHFQSITDLYVFI